MKYYVRSYGKIAGPFTVGEINAKIEAGELSSEFLATSDLGEPVERLLKQGDSDWWHLAEVPGVRGLPQPTQPIAKRDPNNLAIGLITVVLVVVLLVVFFIGYLGVALRDLH